MRKVVDKSILGRVWTVATYPGEDDGPCPTDNLLQKILISRGITDMAGMEKFLNPSVKEYMPNPSVLRDMDVGASVIADAVLAGDKIAVYGDYDVDGITSTAIFVKYLRALGTDVVWHLPTREGEGYGLNISAIDEIADGGAKLIITVDCGISGVAEVEHARQRGMRVVVTDHHSPDSVLPNADAVINPKRADDKSGLQYLAGVGVAFLTLVALRRELRRRDLSPEMAQRVADTDLMDYMDLVALGTICDTMPLVGLNRAFVATGLRVLGLRKNMCLAF